MENKKIAEFPDMSGIREDSNGGDGPMNPQKYVTQEELKEVKDELSYKLDLLEAHLDTKFETVNTKFEKGNTSFANVETKIANSKNTSVVWFIGTSLAIIGVLVGLHFF